MFETISYQAGYSMNRGSLKASKIYNNVSKRTFIIELRSMKLLSFGKLLVTCLLIFKFL